MLVLSRRQWRRCHSWDATVSFLGTGKCQVGYISSFTCICSLLINKMISKCDCGIMTCGILSCGILSVGLMSCGILTWIPRGDMYFFNMSDRCVRPVKCDVRAADSDTAIAHYYEY